MNSVVITKPPVIVERSNPKDLRLTIDAMIQILNYLNNNRIKGGVEGYAK